MAVSVMLQNKSYPYEQNTKCQGCWSTVQGLLLGRRGKVIPGSWWIEWPHKAWIPTPIGYVRCIFFKSTLPLCFFQMLSIHPTSLRASVFGSSTEEALPWALGVPFCSQGWRSCRGHGLVGPCEGRGHSTGQGQARRQDSCCGSGWEGS